MTAKKTKMSDGSGRLLFSSETFSHTENAGKFTYYECSGLAGSEVHWAGDPAQLLKGVMEVDCKCRCSSVSTPDKLIGRFHGRDDSIRSRPGYSGSNIRLARQKGHVSKPSLLIIAALTVGIIMATIGMVNAIKAERKALQEQHTTARTLEYFVESFSLQDSESTDGSRVSAADLLRRSALRIENEMDGEPKVQGELLQTMGQAFENLALYNDAERILQQSLQNRIQAWGENHPKVAHTYKELGEVMWRTGQYDASKRAFEKALEIIERQFGAVNEDMAGLKAGLGMVYLHDANLPEAEALFGESQAIYRLLEKEKSDAFARNLNNIGDVNLKKGDLASAIIYFREALEALQSRHNDPHPDIAQVKSNLGVALISNDESKAAETLLAEALEARRTLYEGFDHSEVAISLTQLASLYQSQHQYEKAQPLLREAVAIQRRVYGDVSSSVAIGLMRLADICFEMKNFTGAEENYREAMIVRRVLLGDEHPDVGMVQTSLAATLVKQGRYTEALREINAALVVLKLNLGPVHWRVSVAQSVKGAALAESGLFEEAEKLMLEAFRDIRESRGDRDVYTQQALDRVIHLYEDWGRNAEALKFRRLQSELFGDHQAGFLDEPNRRA